jgi:hypothetical protein
MQAQRGAYIAIPIFQAQLQPVLVHAEAGTRFAIRIFKNEAVSTDLFARLGSTG